MPLIYVPQGRYARLEKPRFELSGLYTDAYSICNIMACVGENGRIALAHIDIHMATVGTKSTVEMIQWVGSPCRIVLMMREEGKLVTQILLKNLYERLPQQRVELQVIRPGADGMLIDGIQLSFPNQDSEKKEFPITQYRRDTQASEIILHHPQEQQFLAVTKIEQIIGKYAISQTMQAAAKEHRIFDGYAWEPIPEAELKIHNSHPSTQEELDFFKANEPFVAVSGRLMSLVEELSKEIKITEDKKSFVSPIAEYLEAYLNGFDTSAIFKRNILDAIENTSGQRSKTDKDFQKKITPVLQRKDDVFTDIKMLMSEYAAEPSENTQYKKDILEQHGTFSRHYQTRTEDDKRAEKRSNDLKQAQRLAIQATKAYREKHYAAAANLFSEVLALNAWSCLKSNPALAITYYNLGRALYQLAHAEPEHLISAIFTLNTALILRTHYVKSPENEIQKIREALKQCEDLKAAQPAALVGPKC